MKGTEIIEKMKQGYRLRQGRFGFWISAPEGEPRETINVHKGAAKALVRHNKVSRDYSGPHTYQLWYLNWKLNTKQ